MIIPDLDPARKTPISDVQEAPQSSPSQYTPLQSESPPAYYGSHGPLVPDGPLLPQSVQIASSYSGGKSPERRFVHAFAVAWLIWLLLSIFIRTLFFMIDIPTWDRNEGKRHWEYEIPSGFAMSGCIQGSDWVSKSQLIGPADALSRHSEEYPFTSQASFALPIGSDNLFLLARGQMTSDNTLDITTSPKQRRDSVTIQIRMHHNMEMARNVAKVCKMGQAGASNPNGIGMFTPTWRKNQSMTGEKMMFKTTLIFPEAEEGEAPLPIKGLKLDLPSAAYRFADLNKKLHFDTVVAFGVNGLVEAKSLSARTATINNSNGAIRGLFNVTGALVLNTSNGEIGVDVGLEYRGGTKALFSAHTKNGPIGAAVSLTSTNTSLPAAYGVDVSTTNSVLQVHFTSQPVGSKLGLTASTSNGPADVRMNPAFEGDFVLQSTKTIVIQEGKDTADPSGAGRRRNVRFNIRDTKGSLQVIEGSASWVGEVGRWGRTQKPRELVTVQSSAAPLTFEL